MHKEVGLIARVMKEGTALGASPPGEGPPEKLRVDTVATLGPERQGWMSEGGTLSV